jgi:hypothetical protein
MHAGFKICAELNRAAEVGSPIAGPARGRYFDDEQARASSLPEVFGIWSA